jgi:hypothetical protein
VAVALELDADHPAALGEPGKDVAEAALEGDDAAVQANERRSRGVAVLLVPDRDVIDLLVGHTVQTVVTGQTHRPSGDRAVRPWRPEVFELPIRA